MTATIFGGTLDGRTLDIDGAVLHNYLYDRGRMYREVYVWQIIGSDRFLILDEVQEGAFS